MQYANRNVKIEFEFMGLSNNSVVGDKCRL